MGKIKNKNGFTLIESVLSLMILSLALITGVMITHSTNALSANTDFQVIATQFANEKIETLTADNTMNPMQYASISNANYPQEFISYSTTPNFFKRTTSIEEVAYDLVTPQTGSGIKLVVVTVTWGSQAHENVKTTTLLTDHH